MRENYAYILKHPKLKIETLRDRIKTIIDLAHQESLFSIATIEGKKVRQIIGTEFVHAQARFLEYLTRVKRAHEMGLIGKGRMFSEMSIKRQIMKTLEMISDLIPGFVITQDQLKAIMRFPGIQIEKQSVA